MVKFSIFCATYSTTRLLQGLKIDCKPNILGVLKQNHWMWRALFAFSGLDSWLLVKLEHSVCYFYWSAIRQPCWKMTEKDSKLQELIKNRPYKMFAGFSIWSITLFFVSRFVGVSASWSHSCALIGFGPSEDSSEQTPMARMATPLPRAFTSLFLCIYAMKTKRLPLTVTLQNLQLNHN